MTDEENWKVSPDELSKIDEHFDHLYQLPEFLAHEPDQVSRNRNAGLRETFLERLFTAVVFIALPAMIISTAWRGFLGSHYLSVGHLGIANWTALVILTCALGGLPLMVVYFLVYYESDIEPRNPLYYLHVPWLAACVILAYWSPGHLTILHHVSLILRDWMILRF
jgi:hypothetical protein